MATTLVRVKDDDFLECFLFPPESCDSNVEVTEESLRSWIDKLHDEIHKYAKDYTWHRDSLNFQPRTKSTILLDEELRGDTDERDQRLPPHLYASLRFDEDVGDEWFAVYLIFRFTEVFPGLIAKVTDTDGEFLLIEAADVLPNWADPRTCQDRSFIYDGEIHVVRGGSRGFPEMINDIREKPRATRMSDQVQEAVRRRLSVYPAEIQTRMHKARAFLPERAIAILQRDPSLIAAALRSLCRSDPLERKVCRGMRYFPPEQRAMVNVKMTRCLYAMTNHCRYAGDPRTGWNLPSSNDSKRSAHLLGIKIACGLEMLVARAYRDDKLLVDNEDAINKNKNEWNAYVARLISNGYFRDFLEGSQDYNRLLRSAKDYFQSNSGDSSNRTKGEAARVLDIWREAPRCDVQSFDEGRLSPADNDDWLQVNPEELQSMLDEQWSSNERMVDQKPLTFHDKVKEFLGQSSDVEGIPFGGNSDAENGAADREAKGNNMDIDESTKVEFNADAFDSALRGILDLVVPGDDNEFDSSSEGSLGGDDDEDKSGELDKYMRLLDSQLELDLHMSGLRGKRSGERIAEDAELEENFRESAEGEAGGAGPVGNILGGPVRRLMHLHLQSPSSVPPDLQS